MAGSVFPDVRGIIGNDMGMMSGAAAAILQSEAPSMWILRMVEQKVGFLLASCSS